MSIVERIQVLAKQRNETLTGIERALGFSESSIRKWSTNAPSIDKVQKVALYFDVSADYLLGLIDEPRPPKITLMHDDGIITDATPEERALVWSVLEAYRKQKEK